MVSEGQGEAQDGEGEGWPAGAAVAGGGQLALDNGDEQLPWLDSDDDYEADGVDTTRIAAFAIIGLLAIALIVGGIWWLTRRHSDSAMLADGSTIEAPAGPYKTKPEDPGGKTFDGTGDTSFAVGEGQSREGKIAEDLPAPPPVAQTKPDSPAPAPAAGGVGVQVGAYSSRATADAGWSKLVQQYDALSGVSHRVVEGQADIGTVYRLQAIAGDVAAANALCARLKAQGGACQVKQ